MRIKKNDQVKMLSGKNRGKTGQVLRVLREEGRVVVEGLNIVKKHSRPKREGEKGQRLEIPRAVDVSTVMLLCPKCGKAARVGYVISDNEKHRVCKRCKSEL